MDTLGDSYILIPQDFGMILHNIYNEPGNEALIDSLKAELRKLQKQYDDPIETELATAKK